MQQWGVRKDGRRYKKRNDKKIMGLNCGCDERKRKIKSFLHKINSDKQITNLSKTRKKFIVSGIEKDGSGDTVNNILIARTKAEAIKKTKKNFPTVRITKVKTCRFATGFSNIDDIETDFTPTTERRTKALEIYKKTGDIVEALKAKHGNPNLLVAEVFNREDSRKNLDDNARLIAKYSIDPNARFKISTPIEFHIMTGKNQHERKYIPSDGNWVQNFLYKNSGTIIEMKPEQFLGLASDVGTPFPQTLTMLRRELGKSEAGIPNLSTKKKSNGLQIIGHEGRHRAIVAKEKGIELIPVMIESNHSDNPLTELDRKYIKERKFIPEESSGIKVVFT